MAYIKTNWLASASSAPAVSDAEEVVGATSYCLEVSTTGGPTTVQVYLQGSLDGSTWASLTSVQLSGPTTGSAWATDKPTKYLRVVLDALSGGSSPTVSASVAAFGNAT